MKRAALVLAATALAAGGPTMALAAPSTTAKKHQVKKKTRSFTLNVAISTFRTTGNPPVSGSQSYAGTSDGTIGGKSQAGATRGVNTYTGSGNFTGTTTIFTRTGTTNSTLTGSGTLAPNGDITFKGTGVVVGGTNAYRGATGSFTFTGTQLKNSTVVTFVVSGTLKY